MKGIMYFMSYKLQPSNMSVELIVCVIKLVFKKG